MLSVSGTKSCSTSLSSSAPATIIGSNGNLLVDILYCLPVKSLCVFKTVSKHWQSLISDPYFQRNYNLRSRRLSVPALFMKKELMTDIGSEESEFETLVMDERKGIDYVPSDIPIAVNSESHVVFQQSCNGLVLCKLYDDFSESYHHITYVIYNPSMKHCKMLPSPLFRKTGVPRKLQATIAFDPAKSSYYEVVGVWSIDTNKENMHHIQIYSSETDSWRDVGEPFPSPGILSVSGMFWNGSVHWVDRKRATLHYFNIDCELMKTMAMPTQPYLQVDDYIWKIGYFRECRGRIHLMEMRNGGMLHFDIWEMRMDYTGWNFKYYVDLTPLTTVYPGIILGPDVFHCVRLYVLFIEESKDSSRLIFRIARDRVIISFDLKNSSFKKMYDVKPDVWVEGFEYVETLVHA